MTDKHLGWVSPHPSRTPLGSDTWADNPLWITGETRPEPVILSHSDAPCSLGESESKLGSQPCFQAVFSAALNNGRATSIRIRTA